MWLPRESRITGGYGHGCWGQNSGPLEEQEALLTPEPSLQLFSISNADFGERSGQWIVDIHPVSSLGHLCCSFNCAALM